jgi:asparagine synthase (glutamine-hydrolysing)
MARRLSHRGPDDFGSWRRRFFRDGTEFEVGFGHTRLSILDLSPAGHQPMTSADGVVTICYNGEVYNFRQIRDELVERGHRFSSDCDTEVLVEAYRAWGCDAFDRLNGMFAFALWDHARQRLVLVRDRLGIKPLYYRFGDGVLSFASELGALRAHPAFRAEIDPIALGGFVRHGFVAGPRTIYRDTRRLMPGEFLVWEGGEIRTRAWWSLVAPEPADPPRDFAAAVAALDALLGDAVEQRLVSDVPLGAFLSGGVDSSAVVALMRERARGPVRTFSIGFDDPDFDEAPHARRVAEHLKTDHTELYVRSEEAVEVARELPDLYDEPFADASAIPTVLLSRLTRNHVTVALSGDGGDELFGGYDQYGKLRRLLPLLALPAVLRSPLARAARLLPASRLRNGLLHLRSPEPAALAYALVSGLEDETLEALCGHEASLPNPLYLESYRAAPGRDPVQRAMLADARVYLPDDILTKVDRASMSVALEARVPLLDYRVVRFAFALPLEFVWHGGQTKAPLRAVLHRRVPHDLVERPKHGFGIPIAKLLARELGEWRRSYLAPARLRDEGHLAPEGVVRGLADARRRGGAAEETSLLWRLICFQRWLARQHGADAPRAAVGSLAPGRSARVGPPGTAARGNGS